MAARNNITGDEIKSKALSKQGRKNHDRIYAKKSAYEWLKDEESVSSILDPDGWRYNDGVTMDTPISYKDFCYRLQQCTVMGLIPESK